MGGTCDEMGGNLPPEGGGLREDLNVLWTIGPRLWGNCSGRGLECVRSKRPHLLHSCDQC